MVVLKKVRQRGQRHIDWTEDVLNGFDVFGQVDEDLQAVTNKVHVRYASIAVADERIQNVDSALFDKCRAAFWRELGHFVEISQSENHLLDRHLLIAAESEQRLTDTSAQCVCWASSRAWQVRRHVDTQTASD